MWSLIHKITKSEDFNAYVFFKFKSIKQKLEEKFTLKIISFQKIMKMR